MILRHLRCSVIFVHLWQTITHNDITGLLDRHVSLEIIEIRSKIVGSVRFLLYWQLLEFFIAHVKMTSACISATFVSHLVLCWEIFSIKLYWFRPYATFFINIYARGILLRNLKIRFFHYLDHLLCVWSISFWIGWKDKSSFGLWNLNFLVCPHQNFRFSVAQNKFTIVYIIFRFSFSSSSCVYYGFYVSGLFLVAIIS